ncbi:isoprenyl transferase [Salinibacterium sp. ZJ70]|uniref:isoprenyl transferase n=1 Tax=Salinibacterium sp. ZJ70 TaxID=2708084 RepID=UPI00141EE1C9
MSIRYRCLVTESKDLGGSGPLYGLYQARLRRQLQGAPLPQHVAMIIDGNRRWARDRALETAAHGHRAGAQKMREFLGWCDELGIRVVTIYLLSADNLSGRSNEELDQLFEIIGDLADDLSRAADWRIQHVGTTEGLPQSLVDTLKAAENRTAGNRGLHVNLAVGYGGRREIADAMRSIVRTHGATGGSFEELAELLTPELIGQHLYTQGQPDPDLIIRTSGEQRLSDFMLWQAAHSEFYFVEALGPDLREVDFLRALRDYATRHRRFGQ